MKYLVMFALLAAAHSIAQAQGTVNFVNRNPAIGFDQPIFDTGGVSKLGKSYVVAALFFNGNQIGAAAPFQTGASAGYWDPGLDAVRVIDGQPAGSVVMLSVKVWDSSVASTYDATKAAGGGYAESDQFAVTLGGGGDPPGAPADMVNFRSFVYILPEPSVLSIGILGAAVASLYKRRR